jgi:hypothetical protein
MTDVTLVTCRDHPSLPEDDQVLLHTLGRRGIRPRIAIWNDKTVDWSASSVTVLRAAWDSHLHAQEFQKWLTVLATQTHLLNGASVASWNFDKAYLIELRQRGIEVVPTALILSPSSIEPALAELRTQDIVVKPRFGADSFGTQRMDGSVSAIEKHFDTFGGQGGLLIQPFIAEIEQQRERSLVFIGGRYSHALYRNAFGRGPTRQTPDNFHSPTPDELRYCESLFAFLGAPLDYARVDLVPIDGTPTLMELELIDPSLFFHAEPAAADRLAECIALALG